MSYKIDSQAFIRFTDRAKAIAKVMHWPGDEVNVEGAEVTVSGMVSGSWGYHDHEYYCFPVEWMSLPDEEFRDKWNARNNEHREQASAKRVEDERLAKAQKEEQQEKIDRANYERLKSKYCSE